MTSQSLVKLLLTEGDKLILSWFSPLQDQGGYALAVNYGRSFPLLPAIDSDG
jgi:oligosaccharide translocation protein RFT1